MALTKASNRMITGASINVLDFGAVGDGTTDDTVALQAAIDAVADGGILTIPSGTYKTTSTLTLSTNYVHLQCTGLIKFYGSSDVALHLYGSYDLKGITGSVRVESDDLTSSSWADNNIGILLENTYECNLTISRCVGFKTGLKLTASDSRLNGYNNFTLGSIRVNETGILLDTDGIDGATNENNFYGGKIGSTGANVVQIHITDQSATHPINNNRFYGPTIEGDPKYMIKDDGGWYNMFHHPRFERNSSPTHLDKMVYFGANTTNNLVFYGFGSYDLKDSTYTTDTGSNNHIFGFDFFPYTAIRKGGRGYLSSDQLNIVDNTWTTVTLDSTTSNFNDLGGNTDFNTTTYKYTVPTTGFYQIEAQVMWKNTIADARYSATVTSDSTDLLYSRDQASISNYIGCPMSGVFRLSAGEQVYLQAHHTGGADTPDIQGDSQSTFLTLILIMK
jgi:hypothetical protein